MFLIEFIESDKNDFQGTEKGFIVEATIKRFRKLRAVNKTCFCKLLL